MAAAAVGNARVFVGGLTENIDGPALHAAFSEFGTVTNVERADIPRPFAWVQFESQPQADAAIAGMAGKMVNGEGPIRTEAAVDKPKTEVIEDPKAVFVGNLPRSFDRDMLRDMFAEFGPIASARFIRMRGFGAIVFETEEDAKKALVKNGETVEGRVIRVEPESRPVRPKRVRKRRTGGGGGGGGGGAEGGEAQPVAGNPRRVYVGDLAEGTTVDDVRAALDGCGTITAAKIISRRPDNVHSFVTFESSDSVAGALELSGSTLNGATIRVEVETRRPRRAGRRRGGDAPVEDEPANPARVFVGHLPDDTTADAVQELFSEFGAISEVVKRDAAARFCFIVFENADAAAAAVTKNGMEFNGENLDIEQAKPRRGRGRHPRGDAGVRRDAAENQD